MKHESETLTIAPAAIVVLATWVLGILWVVANVIAGAL